MTNVGVYPILNEVADHIYDVGVGTQIGNGIGFTAGHVVCPSSEHLAQIAA